jgi:hypothetical protein
MRTAASPALIDASHHITGSKHAAYAQHFNREIVPINPASPPSVN